MSGKRVEPSISLVSFSCPHCGAHAHQTWYQLVAKSIENDRTPFRPKDESIVSLGVELRAMEDPDEREKQRRLIELLERIRRNEVFLDGTFGEYSKLPELVNVCASR